MDPLNFSIGDHEELLHYKRFEKKNDFFEVLIVSYVLYDLVGHNGPPPTIYEIISRFGQKSKIRSSKNYNVNIIQIDQGIDALDVAKQESDELIEPYTEEGTNWIKVSDYEDAINQDEDEDEERDNDPFNLLNIRWRNYEADGTRLPITTIRVEKKSKRKSKRKSNRKSKRKSKRKPTRKSIRKSKMKSKSKK